MMERTLAIARKEFIHIYRDWRSLFLIIVMPVMLMLLFGYAVTLDVKKVPFCVLDWDGTQESQSFTSLFAGSPYFGIPYRVNEEEEVRRLIDEGKVKMALVIPSNFSALVKAGKKAKVQVLIDGTDSNTANIVLGYVQSICDRYTREKTFFKMERLGEKRLSVPIDARIRIWFNEELESKNYFVPGLIAVIMSIIGVLLTGQVIVREWERGTMELLISSPVRRGELVIGKLCPYFLLGIVDLLLAYLMGRLVFDVPFRGSFVLLFFLSCVYIAAALGLGMTISTVARTQIFANQMAMVIGFLPTFLLSGFTFVIANMPGWLQIITYGIAPRYYVTILREIFLKGSGISFLWKEVAVLVAMGIVAVGIASKLFKKSLRHS